MSINHLPSSQLPQTSTLLTAGPTVYFDGGCPVCSREIAVYQRQDGAESCTWVDVSRCDDSELGSGLTRDAAMKRLHVRQPDGRLVHGARGFAAMWSALPRTAWLGRLASLPPVTMVLEAAYRGFLVLRGGWRPAQASVADAKARAEPKANADANASVNAGTPATPKTGGNAAVNAHGDGTEVGNLPDWPVAIMADLRSDHAGEVGAIQIYRGALAVARDPAVRAFAAEHLATEMQHLQCIERHLPTSARSRLLPAWRVAGWLTGALPALLGPRMFYATIAAVETFVDRHYAEQIDRIDPMVQANLATAEGRRLARLRADLQACREDELKHRDEALAAGVATGALVRVWTVAVSAGSGAAVALARRV